MKRQQDSLPKRSARRILDGFAESLVSDLRCFGVRQQKHLMRRLHLRIEDAFYRADLPNKRVAPLDKRIDGRFRLVDSNAVEDSHEFRHEPACHRENSFGIDVIWADITANVAYSSVIADVVQHGQQPRQKDA